MLRKRIKAFVILILFLIAGVLYSTDRNQDFFMETQECVETGANEADSLQETAEETATNLLRVHVCGAVKHAGVYRLSSDSIVADAIEAAGGFKKSGDQEYLNLAETMADGQKIYVPTKNEVQELTGAGGQNNGQNLGGTIGQNSDQNPGGTICQNSGQNASGVSGQNGQNPGGASSQEAGLVNINTADESLLTTLNGIGTARAQAIIAWRTEHGAFARIEDVMQVSGIKEGAFAKIKDKICV